MINHGLYMRRRKNLASVAKAIVERMEDRLLFSAVVVNTTLDPGPAGTMSLRQAIDVANLNPSPTVIAFDPTVFATAKTITLNGGGLALGASEPTTIVGPAAGVTVSGNDASRGLTLVGSSTTTISGVSFTECFGGAIASYGTLVLSDCTISGNSSDTFADAALEQDGPATLTNVNITGNTTSGDGGAAIGCDGPLTFIGGSISNNTATATGSDAIAAMDYGPEGVANIVDSTISGNTSTPSGGNYSTGGTIVGNGSITLTDVTISGNSCSGGDGEILQCNGDGSFDLTNVTMSGNTATFGIYYNGGGFPGLNDVTIADNNASAVGGVNFVVNNSIISGNTGGNVFNSYAGAGSHNLIGGNALLGPLQNNGGPTLTRLPLAGSPAIGGGDNTLVPTGITTDQRGNARIAGGTVDIGAVEVSTGATASNIALSLPASSILAGANAALTATVTSGSSGGPIPTGSVTFFDGAAPLGTASVQGDGTATFTTALIPNGANSITATYGGDGVYKPSVSSAVAETVITPVLVFVAQPADATVGATFASAVSVEIQDTSGNVYAGASSTVTLAIDSGSGGATLGGTLSAATVNGVATFSGLSVDETGMYALTATDLTFSPAVSNTFTIAGLPSTTTLATSASSVGLGASVTFTATVAPVVSNGSAPTGTVTFEEDGAAIANATVSAGGVAVFSTQSISAGSHQISATYSGDGTYAPSASTPLTQLATVLTADVFAPDITATGATGETITILYVDANSAIDASTIIGANLVVTSPTGSANLDVTATGHSVGSGGDSILATYSVVPPGGAFNFADIGTYSIAVVPGSVKDVNGSGVDVADGSFLFDPFEDPNFGETIGGGSTQSGNISVAFASEDLVSESDGNILVIGSQGNAGANSSQGVLEQLTSTGTPDATFGDNGIATTASGANDQFFDAAIQPDGKIVAVGASNGSFLIARFDADGAADTTFGNGGIATASFGAGGAATAYSVAIEPNGSIVVAGGANGMFGLARFTSAGMLDASAADNGAAGSASFVNGQLLVPGTAGAISQVIVQNNGDILGVGVGGSTVTVFRLNSDGSADSSFNGGSPLTITQLSSHTASIGVQPGGGILIAGGVGTGGLAAVHLTSAGQVDPSFGAGGVSVADFGGATDAASSITVDPASGAFVLVGTTTNGAMVQTALAAFNPDGSVNPVFGGSGQTTLPAPSASGASTSSVAPLEVRPFSLHPQYNDIALAAYQSDGKIVVGGSNQMETAIRRLQSFTLVTTPVGPGAFGRVNRKNVKLPTFALNGVMVTITLSGGSAMASTAGNDLELTNVTGSPSIAIKTRGGMIHIGDITAEGNLHALLAPTAILDGTLSTTGSIGALQLQAINGVVLSTGAIASVTAGNVSGSISSGSAIGVVKLGMVTGIISALQIKKLAAGALSGATVLAGAKLSATDGVPGGASVYTPGNILSLTVDGPVSASFIGAGVNPVDGLFGDGDDVSAGGKSGIKVITIKGALDSATLFESAALPRKVVIAGKPLATAGNGQFKIVG